jgi:hypothetical protein
MYDCPKSRFRMMSNHIDARSWAVPTLQNDLNAVTVSITDYYPDKLLGGGHFRQGLWSLSCKAQAIFNQRHTDGFTFFKITAQDALSDRGF